MPAPAASLSLLHRADGSATYSSDGYTVVGAVNGPVEVQRRDELPDEASLEVNVRPVSGVGNTRERHLESILHTTLRHILLLREFPRSLLQITLQILGAPERPDGLRAASYLPLLPPLLTASVLTLLSAHLPLSTTLTSTLIAVNKAGGKQKFIIKPTPRDILVSSSLHVFGFTGRGELLLSESEGEFDIATWNQALEVAEEACLGVDTEMQVESDGPNNSQSEWLRKMVGEKVERDQRWRVADQG